MEHLRGMIAGAEINEIGGMGYYAGSDRGDVFNALVLEFVERHAPRVPLTYLGGPEPRRLRDALGCFATGVTVITPPRARIGDDRFIDAYNDDVVRAP